MWLSSWLTPKLSSADTDRKCECVYFNQELLHKPTNVLNCCIQTVFFVITSNSHSCTHLSWVRLDFSDSSSIWKLLSNRCSLLFHSYVVIMRWNHLFLDKLCS